MEFSVGERAGNLELWTGEQGSRIIQASKCLWRACRAESFRSIHLGGDVPCDSSHLTTSTSHIFLWIRQTAELGKKCIHFFPLLSITYENYKSNLFLEEEAREEATSR